LSVRNWYDEFLRKFFSREDSGDAFDDRDAHFFARMRACFLAAARFSWRCYVRQPTFPGTRFARQRARRNDGVHTPCAASKIARAQYWQADGFFRARFSAKKLALGGSGNCKEDGAASARRTRRGMDALRAAARKNLVRASRKISLPFCDTRAHDTLIFFARSVRLGRDWLSFF
jgi:hypothetical protein